jgi:hypothetical protein
MCAAAFLCLLGCQTLHDPSRDPHAPRVYLTDTRTVEVLPPAALGGELEAYQQIEGSFRGETYYLDAYVQADREHFVMAAFNSFGTRVFEMEQAGGTLRFSSTIVPGNMKAEYILEDFQLCFFPSEPLRRSLESAGLSFVERQEGEERVRTVSGDGRLIIEIRTTPGQVSYRNLLRGYQYVVRGN